MTVAFDEVAEKVADAARQVEADGGASPVLCGCPGVPGEACEGGDVCDWRRARHDSVELEQAGDSAKAAAEADVGLSSDSRESVLAAHLAICKLKAGA